MSGLFNDNPMTDIHGFTKGKVCLKCNNFAVRSLTYERNDTNNQITVCLLRQAMQKRTPSNITTLSDMHEGTLKACGKWADKKYLPF